MSGTDLWATDGGVYFGNVANATEWGDDTKIEEEWRYIGDRHLLSIGPNGSGKSRRVILPNLALLTGWSMVVVDPKGELARMTLKHRKEAGNDVIVLDPFEAGGFPTDSFNPIAALDPSLENDDFVDDVMNISEAMIRVSGREPHWSASAQDLVASFIMAEAVANRRAGSFERVRAMLGLERKKFRANVAAITRLAEQFGVPELSVKAERFSNKSKEIDSVVSTALTQTRWLDSRPMKKNLSSGGADRQIDFAQLKEKPTTIYIILPARRLETHAVWMRMIIASILQPLMKDTAKSKVPVMLILDEFPALCDGPGAGFPVIDRNYAMMRGNGIKTWVVVQDLNQMQRIYGKDGWESFVSNAGVLQSFAPQDIVTAKYLSDLMPLAPHTTEQRTHGFGGQGPKASEMTYSVNATEQGMPLMLPQHLRNMDDGFSVLFSHVAKGPMRRYFPWERKGLEHIYALDPARRPQ